ncbi:MAG: hypothetical protein COA58_13680 [Bacteroidetes bacterium]|nr:MAG: hypothetical protein COA58_13680 [Bacteroidota bacterium]
MKYILSICYCFLTYISFGQNEPKKEKCQNCVLGLGITYGMSFTQKPSSQPFGLHIYPDQRIFYISSELEFGIILKKNTQIRLNYSSKKFRFDQETYDKKMQKEYSEFYFYNNEHYGIYEPTTDFTEKDFEAKNLMLKVQHTIKKTKYSVFPSLGIGIEKWKHKNYQYVLRKPSSNIFTTYEISSHFKPSLVLEPSVSISIPKYPIIQLELGISHSIARLNYDVKYKKSNENFSSTENIKFDKNMTGFYVTLVLRGELN